ncbi:hypothetical protein RvY_04388 [Ramazzottius varieornatus]|uniref:Uncharacterized protein n=1 Tax=Ramazzottius varieornatus TaxID=947166 RepID=A0A1D1V1H0_RAMVA|nr:hypothetical protein RvY_04388 [Ramazzottius varieornatus]
MPLPEKFPKPKRLHQKHRMENVVRPRPDYRRLANLSKPEDALARRRQKDAEEAREAAECSREHRSKSGDGLRISLPAKPARLGNIFGNMRTSDPVGRTTKSGHQQTAEKVFSAHKVKPQPFFSGQPRTNLPEQIQRFLQEPSLVSFGDRQLRQEKDDLDWVDADIESFDGVSERVARQNQRRDKPPDPARPCRPEDLDERMEMAAEVSEHASQQSTQIKREKFLRSPRQLKKVADAVSALNEVRAPKARRVSRACSPIVIIPDDEQGQALLRADRSRRTLRVRNEAVQVRPDEFINQSLEHSDACSDPSLANSVKLGLPQTQKNFFEELGLAGSQDKDVFDQFEEKREMKEKVRSRTRQEVRFCETVSRMNHDFISAPANQYFLSPHVGVLGFGTQQKPIKRSIEQEGKRRKLSKKVSAGNFDFNPTPVFHDNASQTFVQNFGPRPEVPVEENGAFQQKESEVVQRVSPLKKDAQAQDVLDFLDRATSKASQVRERQPLPMRRAKTVIGYSMSASAAPQNVPDFLDRPHTEVREYFQGSNDSLPWSKTPYQFPRAEPEIQADRMIERPEVERLQKVAMDRPKTSHRLRVYPRKMF